MRWWSLLLCLFKSGVGDETPTTVKPPLRCGIIVLQPLLFQLPPTSGQLEECYGDQIYCGFLLYRLSTARPDARGRYALRDLAVVNRCATAANCDGSEPLKDKLELIDGKHLRFDFVQGPACSDTYPSADWIVANVLQGFMFQNTSFPSDFPYPLGYECFSTGGAWWNAYVEPGNDTKVLPKFPAFQF